MIIIMIMVKSVILIVMWFIIIFTNKKAPITDAFFLTDFNYGVPAPLPVSEVVPAINSRTGGFSTP